MLQRPSIKLPTRRLSQLTKTPTKHNNNNNDNNENDNLLNLSTMNNIDILSPKHPLSTSSTIVDDRNISNCDNRMQVDTLDIDIDNDDDDEDGDDDNGENTDFVESTIKNTDNIQVMVRIRPRLSDIEQNGRVCVESNESNTVRIECKPKPKTFTFDHVGSMNSTQESIFQSVGKPITNACLSGYNGTIFAYGQTGSGKTFTLLGYVYIHNKYIYYIIHITPNANN